MVCDRQPQGTRCNSCNRLILGTTDDIKVACDDVVLCIECAKAAWTQVSRYGVNRRSPGQ
jgi:hypothetical protein